MRNWRRWIRPGLVVTALVALAAVLIRAGDIERDLAGRVAERLAEDGQDWASVEVSARNVTIAGTAPAPESQALAVRAAESVPGVRGVSDASELLPLVSPYVWRASKTGRAVAVGGSVPSESQRNAILAAARRALPEAEIVDDLELARGAPASFGAATTFALTALAGLADGAATLTDATLTLTGTATDAAAYDALRNALSAGDTDLPVALGPVDLLPARADPFVWSADFDGDTATLAGFVPNEVDGEALVAAVQETLPEATVVNDMAVASGAPDGFAEAAAFAVSLLGRLDSGGVTLDGTTLDVAGTAKSVDDYEAMQSAFSGALPADMDVVATAIMPATVDDYGWQGEKSGDAVVLTGFVPSEEGRDEVAATAAVLFAGMRVDNRVRVAAGAPRMDWLGAIDFAMGQLTRLKRGKVTVGDRTYAIEGEAASSEAFTAIAAANAETLPASLQLEQADVVPPHVSSYAFVAERVPGGLTIGGHVASEDDRQVILAAAHRKFGTAAIEDGLAFASGAPEGYVDAATTVLQAVSRLAGGRAEIAGQSVAVDGGAYYPAAVGAISTSISDALPEGYAVTASAIMSRQPNQPVTAARCRDLLQAVLETGRIEFDGSGADISPDSQGLLDRVASAIQRCPDTYIEVGAHSDSDGSAEGNRERTQARADAIVDYLVVAGIRRERLRAVGYGESEPLADNSTEEGKAMNRRIAFTVELLEGG